jgi:transposase
LPERGNTAAVYYVWSKEFLEAGKKRLQGDTLREATSSEVGDLKKENDQLKALVAELSLKNRVLKKTLSGLESEYEGQ